MARDAHWSRSQRRATGRPRVWTACFHRAGRVAAPKLADVGPIAVGALPRGVAVNATTNTVYVTNSTDGTVSVIDGASNRVTATLKVGTNPFAIAVDETTDTIYVANFNTNDLSIIDGATNTVISMSIGVHPEGIGVDEATHTVYLACQTNPSGAMTPSVWVINGQSRRSRPRFQWATTPTASAWTR